ncbi:hypothetical protein [Serpentinicella alkaliphila]|uniref:Uncharacterized protein n=1 Tax=Serpentinicella alkaliphila TaxID=1734049 RepID=A0A4R2TIM2_9FIRM|nr:hypothetical protein [Serpentinicella alkaliphila]QUH24607.1 hypothetical protein HZR23_01560 [Serpentinicella alkaliphila]TCQ02606.1 hypothetical protein EDD79_101420 [Serpentinicella alkaliphila]
MSKFEIKNFIKIEPTKSQIEPSNKEFEINPRLEQDIAVESIEVKELQDNNVEYNTTDEVLAEATTQDNNLDEEVTLEQEDVEALENSDTIVCNIDLNNLMNKFLNLDALNLSSLNLNTLNPNEDINSQLTTITSNQHNLIEKIEKLTEKIDNLENSIIRHTYRGDTKIYY